VTFESQVQCSNHFTAEHGLDGNGFWKEYLDFKGYFLCSDTVTVCWLGVRKRIQPVKTEWWGVGVVICLERGADCLHMVQDATAIPIFSCLVKIQTGFTFLWLIQNLQSTPYLGSCGHEHIGSVADSSAAKSDNCWVALLTGLGYHVVYFLHNQYTHPALTAAAYIYYTKHTVVVRNGNDALPSSSSEKRVSLLVWTLARHSLHSSSRSAWGQTAAGS